MTFGSILTGCLRLQLEKATLARRLQLESGLAVEEHWYAHLVHRQLLVHEITLNNSGTKARSLPIDAVASSGPPGNQLLNPGSFVYTNVTSGGVFTVFGAANHSERPELQQTQVAVASNAVATGASLSVGAGEVKTFYFISAVSTSLDSADPKSSAEQALKAALAPQTAAGLRASPLRYLPLCAINGPIFTGCLWSQSSHEAAWKARWDQGRVEVGGNLGLAQAINSSMYFLLSSVRVDWPQGMSPGGLASDGCKNISLIPAVRGTFL